MDGEPFMNRRHFLKALVAGAATISLAPKLLTAATIDQATKPYWTGVDLASGPDWTAVTTKLQEYGTWVKVSDLHTEAERVLREYERRIEFARLPVALFAPHGDVRSLWTAEQQARLAIDAGFREGVTV